MPAKIRVNSRGLGQSVGSPTHECHSERKRRISDHLFSGTGNNQRCFASLNMTRTRANAFLIRSASLLGCALAQQLGNVEVDEISVMKNDRFNRALCLITFMTVRGDNVQDFTGNPV